jgi:hypothetical protein
LNAVRSIAEDSDRLKAFCKPSTPPVEEVRQNGRKKTYVKTRRVSENYQYSNGLNTVLLRKQKVQYQNLKKALDDKANARGVRS